MHHLRLPTFALLGLALVASSAALAQSTASTQSQTVKDTLKYEKVGLIDMATSGELILRDPDGICLKTVAHPPVKQPGQTEPQPIPNIDVRRYACTANGDPKI